VSCAHCRDLASCQKELWVSFPKHREYVREEYEQHAREHIRDFETFYESQLTWEETMAETLARKLIAQGAGEQVVVLVGKGHMSSRVGIPQFTLDRVAHTHKTVIPVPVRESAEDIGAGVADYVWVTERSEPFHRGRLGVAIRQPQAGEGLEIMSVVPESPAEKAGVKAGDVLLMIDGKVIKDLEELHKAVAGENPVHLLTLRRDGTEISVTVTLSP
jgi:S1-C subfamily serine protease